MIKQRGFTLIEVMIVMSIIALISATVLPMFDTLRQSMSRNEEAARVNAYAKALQAYYWEKIQLRRSLVTANINGGAGNTAPLLLPDVSAAATPYEAAQIAATEMVVTGAVGEGLSPVDLYSATSNKSRLIALYIQQPDESGTNASYSNFVASLAPNITTNPPVWGAAYCPDKINSFFLGTYNVNPDKSLMPLALVVSAGANGVFDTFGGAAIPPTNPNWTAQGFTIQGDDKGMLINFSALHNDVDSQINKMRLERIASAMSSYYRYRYTQDAFVNNLSVSALLSTDYFASINSITNLQNILGIPANDLVDQFGNPFQITQLLATHPFTMTVYTLCGESVGIPASAP